MKHYYGVVFLHHNFLNSFLTPVLSFFNLSIRTMIIFLAFASAIKPSVEAVTTY